ncbi:hypothetical protein BDK51DRAFT_34760 [Blyttiomyces helicus]|uniref:SGNH hydrolase-type esterase domain-containing protein n=1 Tax=Blyttiomyces helicus TaxID=388810 RepID=A0A4P9W894_9FUNG|nr:hypothetical protein BDK51DRAFT_34760 [Blyttiomyces helicus]|eukprot:RKO87010.1 hypothetical protein BDK51DRAFT_34760 [Blyttiomyces helicus]
MPSNETVTAFLVPLTMFLQLLWIRFNHRLTYLRRPPPQWISSMSTYETNPSASFRNKIVILGDDFAYGIGDHVSMGDSPGLASHLRRALRSEKLLRQSWVVYNCGVRKSTSEQWLDSFGGGEGGGQQWSTPSTKSLFAKVFDNPRYSDADSVIIFLGFNDSRYPQPSPARRISAESTRPSLTPDQTIQNLSAITRVLRAMGKDVWVLPVATFGDHKHVKEIGEGNIQRNEMILELGNNLHPPRPTSDKSDVQVGPRIDMLHYEYRGKRLYWLDGEHFSSAGYKKLAKDLADQMATSLVKREFAKFREQLGM